MVLDIYDLGFGIKKDNNNYSEILNVENITFGPSLGIISSIDNCQSSEASMLCIHNIRKKLKQSDHYDIGGTYTDKEPDIWFYCTTSVWPGYNMLLNLFACHRKVGNFSVTINSSNQVVFQTNKNCVVELKWCNESTKTLKFRSVKPNENYFINTYCFPEKFLDVLKENSIHIPIKIEINNPQILDDEIMKTFSSLYNFSELLKKEIHSDFVLESASRKKYPVHKLFLAAHSPVFKDIVKQTNTSTMLIDISDDEMKVLLNFIYTGTVGDIMKQDCMKLLEIGHKFQLRKLLSLTQSAVSKEIKIDNAIEFAYLAHKYNLQALWENVIHVIKNNPDVLNTDGWKNLNDVELSKKLFQFVIQK